MRGRRLWPSSISSPTARAVSVIVALYAAAAGACVSDNGSLTRQQPSTTPSPTAGSMTPRDAEWQRIEGLRGTRYCEVLLLRVVDGRLNAEVWNTITRSDCPQEAWDALDMDAIKTERGAVAALRNGPRHWLTDAIERKRTEAPPAVTTFGTLEMSLGATVDLGPIPPDLSAYKERIVARTTIFEYAAGARVYELSRPGGKTYIMQSYSIQADPTVTEADLEGLASRLDLPDGWTYRARTLDAPLRVETSAAGATVIQDSFSNTYQLIE